MLKTELSDKPKWPNIHYGYAIRLLDNLLYLITYRVVLIKQDAKNETLLGYLMNLLKRPVNDRKYVFHFRPKPKLEKHLALGWIPKPKPKVQIYVKIGGILLKFIVSNDLSN